MGVFALLTAHVLAQPQPQQQSIPIRGDRLSGFVLPIEPIAGDIQMAAMRASAWTVDDTKRLLLQGDVKTAIGGYNFVSDRAAVWINRIPSAEGVINQVAIYFESVSDPTKLAGLGAQGENLLVTGSTRGEVKLNVALFEQEQPRDSRILRTGEARLAEHLKRLLAAPPPLEDRPQVDQPDTAEEQFVPVPGGKVQAEDLELPSRIVLPPVEQTTPWLADPQGVVRFSADHIEVQPGETENLITIVGSIVVEYASLAQAEDFSHLLLTAERAVIFMDPGPLEAVAGQVSAQSVRGIYLEGAVTASSGDGQYVIRAPRVYYDFHTHQALMLDSLLRIQPRDFTVPVYARAAEMRQLAENQWDAKQIRASTSEFFVPHLAIGAERMTVTDRATEGESSRIHLESVDNTLRVAGTPIFGWPRFSGDIRDIPLRSIQIGTRSHVGLGLETTWDLFSLLGREEPDGVEADLRIDGYTERGVALGTEWRYDVAGSEGTVELYGLYDQGDEDRTSAGLDVEPPREFRGIALLEHQTQLTRYWSLQAQASLISDETFVTSWLEDDFLERREYETSLYLKHQRDNAALTILGKYELNDFISNAWLLASRQYAVDKLPELTYRRYGDSIFGDGFTYSMENRVTRMRLVFQETTPEEIGVRGRAFGIANDTLIADALLARGLRENWVNRFDSRHELAMPRQLGIFKVVPFIVGRFTGYDDDFEEFSSDSDEMRFFGAVGLRASTQFQRIYNNAENRLFDVHRLRHIIEPYVTVWAGTSNVDQSDLPVYDEQVESISDGQAVQLGVRNVLQTHRGGPGMWRSVDMFTLDTSVVIDSEGEPNESPTPQFFDYRPEYSQFGSHFRAQAIWLLSDSLSLTGEGIYTLETDRLARGSIGIELRHSPLLTTYIEYRVIDASHNELLALGWIYQITPKYRIVFVPQYDFREEDLRSLSLRLTRYFPDFALSLQVRHDQIRDDTSVGASLDLVEF